MFLTALIAGILYLHFAPVDFDAGMYSGGFQTWVFDKYKDELVQKFINGYEGEISAADVEVISDSREVSWENRKIYIEFDVKVNEELYRIHFVGTRVWIETYLWGGCRIIIS